MERARGVLFDKDGTLIDFERTWFPVVAELMQDLRGRYGAPERALRAIARASGVTDSGFERESLVQSATTETLAVLWSALLRGYGLTVDAAEIGRLFTATAVRLARNVSLVPGTKNLLERLKNRGYRLGIATADTRESTEAGLRSVGILEYFEFISADGDGFPAKPEPAAALAFGARFGISPRDLVVVGDSRGDMSFAQKAGARFIGMRTACNAPENFTAAGYPVIADFSDSAAFERLIA